MPEIAGLKIFFVLCNHSRKEGAEEENKMSRSVRERAPGQLFWATAAASVPDLVSFSRLVWVSYSKNFKRAVAG